MQGGAPGPARPCRCRRPGALQRVAFHGDSPLLRCSIRSITDACPDSWLCACGCCSPRLCRRAGAAGALRPERSQARLAHRPCWPGSRMRSGRNTARKKPPRRRRERSAHEVESTCAGKACSPAPSLEMRGGLTRRVAGRTHANDVVWLGAGRVCTARPEKQGSSTGPVCSARINRAPTRLDSISGPGRASLCPYCYFIPGCAGLQHGRQLARGKKLRRPAAQAV